MTVFLYQNFALYHLGYFGATILFMDDTRE